MYNSYQNNDIHNWTVGIKCPYMSQNPAISNVRYSSILVQNFECELLDNSTHAPFSSLATTHIVVHTTVKSLIHVFLVCVFYVLKASTLSYPSVGSFGSWVSILSPTDFAASSSNS